LGFVNVSSLREPIDEGQTHVMAIVETVEGGRFTARLAGDPVTVGPILGQVEKATPLGPISA
jgi:hypothetical protein